VIERQVEQNTMLIAQNNALLDTFKRMKPN
jgi:hypothetical protein